MSTVVRSLAAKVEVQTREAEQNLDRFRAKLRATDVQLRGASAYQNGGPSPLYSAGAVARQSVAARGIAVQEMFAAQQARMASVGAIGSRMFGGSGIPVTSSEIDSLTVRGGGSIGGGGNALGEMAGAGAAGQAGGILSKVKGLGRFSALLRGAGPVAAAVVTVRHAIQTTADVMDNADKVTDDSRNRWDNYAYVLLDAASRFTLAKGPLDNLANSLVNMTDYGAAAIAKTEALTAALSEQAAAKMKSNEERDKGSAMMADEFMGGLADAQIASLSEQAEQTERFADMQSVASSAAERYDARINELRFSLMAGAISQDAFNESLKAANDTYDEQSGIIDEIRERNALYTAELEDKVRAEAKAKDDAKRFLMESSNRAQRERAMEGIAFDASRSGRGGGGKYIVEDPQFKLANQYLRRIADNVGIARAR